LKTTINYLFLLTMAVTYGLLAMQAEPITATLGWIFGALIAISVIAKWRKSD